MYTDQLHQLNHERRQHLGRLFPSVPVLDHGYVSLVDCMGDDAFIVECARMSTDGSFQGWDKDMGMLDHMYRHRHSSPFEFGCLVFEIQAPIVVYRQWHRHRTFAYSEMSGRYCELPDLFFLPPIERMQGQSKINKQASNSVQLDFAIASDIQDEMAEEQEMVRANYESYLARGLSRELARNNLPVSQYSRMRAVGNPKNWLHFLSLRKAPDAQKEIRQFADAVGDFFQRIWPRTYALFEEYDLYGIRFGQTEADILRALLDSPAAQSEFQRLVGVYGLNNTKTRELTEKLFPSTDGDRSTETPCIQSPSSSQRTV